MKKRIVFKSVGLTKLVGFIRRQLQDSNMKNYPAFCDDRGIFYINDEGDRITVLASEVV